MTVNELETKLLALSLAEKMEALRILTQSSSGGARGISKTPDVCGGNACIDGTRIPVWLLASFRRQGSSDAECGLEFYPHLSAADLVNAWAYAEAYPEEIEQAIRENDEVMEESEVA